jgi:hypothetical protein
MIAVGVAARQTARAPGAAAAVAGPVKEES